MRARISLDGTWQFLHVGDDRFGELETRYIQVPGPWQAQFPDLRMQAGTGIYRRSIEVPQGWRQGRVFLHFGAVFHHAAAWVNGVPVGTHRGGFLPFCFDVTEHLNEGANEIKVRAESPTDDPSLYPEAPFAEIPFGKQSWYGPLSGIWQSVHLERRDVDHVRRVRLRPDLAMGRVAARLFLHRELTVGARIEAEIVDPSGEVAASAVLNVHQGVEEVALDLGIADVLPWSPDAPNLYRFRARMVRDGHVLDESEESFGFRTFEAREGRFYLNGEPLYLRAALDQDYYPDTICTVPSVEFLEDQLVKAKELGLNCLRCHIKAADPRYYEVADRLGMLIWTELPNGGLSTERSRARKEALLKGIVDRDGNHPSIVIWTIVNENWGVDLVHDADHRAWLKRTFVWLKAYDPTRLVVDNSPLAPSFHVQTDIADYHYYAAIPDHRDEWDAFVDKLADRTVKLFSPEGDAIVTGDEPVMCSEFGNWGLPHPADLRDEQGREPWWFETGHDWGEGVMYPHGIENRFSDWSMGRVFGSLRRFVDAAQWQQFRALKYQIEAMRRKPGLAGYAITELTDVHWEANGLLDMRRNRRVFHDQFRTINADTVIVPKWERLSYWAGEPMRLKLAIAHGAGPVLEGASLDLADGQLRLPLPRIEPGSVLDLGEIVLRAPDAAEPRMERVALRLRAADGSVLSENHLDVAVHPARASQRLLPGPVWSPDPRIAARLALLGYRLAVRAEEASLIVAECHDDAIAAGVRQGGRLLLLGAETYSLNPFFPHWQSVKFVSRDDTPWRGDWASSFAWLDRRGPFATIPGGPLLDETCDRIVPSHVITGCNLIDFQARVYAGLVVGWIHKPVALAVERAYGDGRLLASTFRLFRDEPLADPTATRILDGLIATAAGVAVRARFEEEAKAA